MKIFVVRKPLPKVSKKVAYTLTADKGGWFIPLSEVSKKRNIKIAAYGK
jgi:hypothetical protein